VDGAESVAKAASERLDLVLMDIQPPALDGHDATRHIKAFPGFAVIPIIAVSSFAMKGDDEKAGRAPQQDRPVQTNDRWRHRSSIAAPYLTILNWLILVPGGKCLVCS
jgi:CheY-like chemotaxis protein